MAKKGHLLRKSGINSELLSIQRFTAVHVVVRRHAHDWSDVGRADPRAMVCGGGAGLPSLTLVLEYIPPVLFKFSDSLVDRVALGITVCSQIWPALLVNMPCVEGLFEAVVVSVLGCTSLSLFSRWRVRHTIQSSVGDGPPFWKHDLHIGPDISVAWLRCWDLSLLQNFNVWDEVTLVNVDDGAETALVEALEEKDVTAVGHSGPWAVEKGGKNNSPVDADLRLALQVFVVSNSFVQSTKGAVGLRESVVNFFVDLCIRWYGTAQVSELLSWYQLRIANGYMGRA